ncbi:MAG TPA: four helix bundle protein [Verrucomicrobiota bacterium]|jgi:four helix bundle protein|nr:four helix bundle protein [Verrucomicrobiota bacterium]HQL79549.1 four helix bundle protein [Verrucomicrobiota bacterium]
MRDYSKIEAWKLADDLTVAIYERTQSFPREEMYGLTSQLRRASYSVPANIVEGASRESKKDYLHFLHIARGSLSETQYFIHLARRLGHLSHEEADKLHGQTKLTFACLHGLTQAVGREAGQLSKVIAAVTSLLVIGMARLVRSPMVS